VLLVLPEDVSPSRELALTEITFLSLGFALVDALTWRGQLAPAMHRVVEPLPSIALAALPPTRPLALHLVLHEASLLLMLLLLQPRSEPVQLILLLVATFVLQIDILSVAELLPTEAAVHACFPLSHLTLLLRLLLLFALRPLDDPHSIQLIVLHLSLVPGVLEARLFRLHDLLHSHPVDLILTLDEQVSPPIVREAA